MAPNRPLPPEYILALVIIALSEAEEVVQLDSSILFSAFIFVHPNQHTARLSNLLLVLVIRL